MPTPTFWLVGFTDTLGNPITSGVTFYGTASSHGSNNSTSSGNAFANPATLLIDAIDPLDLQIGEGVNINTMAAGFSNAPSGDAASNHRADGHLNIVNGTAEPVVAHFVFSYGWSIAKSVGSLSDLVTAGYRFNFHTHGATLSESLETTRILDAPVGSFSDTIEFFGTFPVGERGVHIIAEALGTAHSAPGPSSIVLLLTGSALAGGVYMCRRKLRQAAGPQAALPSC